jgi:hypothetical protein
MRVGRRNAKFPHFMDFSQKIGIFQVFLHFNENYWNFQKFLFFENPAPHLAPSRKTLLYKAYFQSFLVLFRPDALFPQKNEKVLQGSLFCKNINFFAPKAKKS